MTAPPRLASLPLLPRLAQALAQAEPRWGGAALELMPDKGLAHHHVRLTGCAVLARVPKQSQLRLGARDNLAYQAACFERASVGGHAPRLFDVLEPSQALPRGALLVEEIVGRAARLPDDLPAIAVALARIHALDLPPPGARAPVLDAADPLRAMLEEIEAQAQYVEAAQVAPTTAAAMAHEVERLRAVCRHAARPVKRLISFDAHPGNFVVRRDGSAVLVDLEKCRYSYPALDLAHATLYTSTTWEAEGALALSGTQIAAFYAAWSEALGSEVEVMHGWNLVLRRAMWLWSVTWCAKWRVLSGGEGRRESPPSEESRQSDPDDGLGPRSADGEDWSERLSDAALIHHVRERVNHYLSPSIVQQVLEGFDAF